MKTLMSLSTASTVSHEICFLHPGQRGTRAADFFLFFFSGIFFIPEPTILRSDPMNCKHRGMVGGEGLEPPTPCL